MTIPTPGAASELLPCPFCGSSMRDECACLGERDGEPWTYIECEACGAIADEAFWNRRTPPPQEAPARDTFDHWRLRQWSSMFGDQGFTDAASDMDAAADFIEEAQGTPIGRALELIAHAREWFNHQPHGDNCFVSDHYEGDPGNRCNCGRDSLERAFDSFEEAEAPAPVTEGAQREAVARHKNSLPTVDVELHQRADAFADDDTVTYALHTFQEHPRTGRRSERRRSDRESMRAALRVAFMRNAPPPPDRVQPERVEDKP